MASMGEIDEVLKELDIEWKIKDFFSIPEEDGECYFSPIFSFAGESWTIGMCLQESDDIGFHFGLHLIRNEFRNHPIRLKCILGLKTANGRKDKENHHTHVFDRERYKCGVAKLISKSELLLRKDELVPNNILIVVCTLKYTRPDEDTNVSPLESCIFQNQYKILQDYKALFLKKEDCDIIIRVQGQEFSAHSAILKARSPVFASTFRHDTKEKATGTIDIEDCDAYSFSDFLCFLYCGDTDVISVENVFNLFTAADKYDVKDLRLKCMEFMKENLSVVTFCDTITLALLHCERELIYLATNFFTKHSLEIAKTVKWQLFSAKNPTQSNELFIKALQARTNH